MFSATDDKFSAVFDTIKTDPRFKFFVSFAELTRRPEACDGVAVELNGEQKAAFDAFMGGSNICVLGPPGVGKVIQTNLYARALHARGAHVLTVCVEFPVKDHALCMLCMSFMYVTYLSS